MTKQVASSVMGHRKGSRAPWLGSGAGRHSLPGKVTLEPRGGREVRFRGWRLWWPGDSGRLVQRGELVGHLSWGPGQVSSCPGSRWEGTVVVALGSVTAGKELEGAVEGGRRAPLRQWAWPRQGAHWELGSGFTVGVAVDGSPAAETGWPAGCMPPPLHWQVSSRALWGCLGWGHSRGWGRQGPHLCHVLALEKRLHFEQESSARETCKLLVCPAGPPCPSHPRQGQSRCFGDKV